MEIVGISASSKRLRTAEISATSIKMRPVVVRPMKFFFMNTFLELG